MNTKNTNAGFSLIELVVAMTVFSIVTASIFGLLQVAGKARMSVNESTALDKSVRLGLNLVGRDTYNAGYGYPLRNTVILTDNRISTLLGIPVDTDSSRDTVAPIIAANNLNPNTFNPVANTKTDQVTFLFKDTSFNPQGSPAVSQPMNINAATTNGSGIDEVVPVSGSNVNCKVNDLYLVSGSNGSTLAVVTAKSGTNIVQFGNSDVLNINQAGSSGPLRGIIPPASVQKVNMITYLVTTDGVFLRREYANAPGTAAYVDEPLIYGVEDFQVRYVMDDGSVNDNPLAGPDGIAGNADDTPANLAAVRQVRFTINVRSTEKNVDNKPFRTTMTTTFSTRNLGYDAN